MLRKTSFALVLSFLIPFVAQAYQPVVLTKASSMLKNVRSTQYQHETDIDEARGKYFADCSGFLDYILAAVSPNAWKSLSAMTQKYDPGTARPLAKHFVFYFDEDLSKTKGWRRVGRVEDLKPGDIIAWLTPEDSDSKNTGHVMIAATRPRPAPDHAREFELRVIDSTRSGHGQDPRKPSGPNGLGTGFIHLVEDKDGQPYAYRWKGNESTRIYKTTIRLARPRS